MKPKILFLDIEATNLNANYGFVLCVGYKYLGQKRVYCPTLADFRKSFGKDCTNDKKLLKEIRDVIEGADLIVTWYGKRFDIPYLQTRLLLNNLPPYNVKSHLDLWVTAKRHLKFNSNRLDTVSRVLPTKNKEYKTPIESIHWIRASAGHKPSINYVKKHCVADIKVLEQVYQKMLPFIQDHPNLAYLLNPEVKGDKAYCPNCGHYPCMRDGYAATKRQVKQVWYCKSCKHHYQTGV